MSDYGHDLTFGTFLTPSADHPERVIALAQLTERSELDLVTFQDHPYHPGFLDTWTLLAYAAAKTSRVSLSANVLNLPLRGPAIVAKSAASLDLLSAGRFELGLGAGAFWDAIAAFGGPHLTPGQAVDALDEGIRIIRGLWDVDDRAVLKIDGEHHHISGAKRGPAPAHDVGIWLGALKPRMLRLIGRAADGWLPSLSRLEVGGLAEGNKVIDDAATQAGRDPRAIRRLLNIGPALGVEQMAELALEDGIGTFVLATDDPDAIRRFGLEVAPAVRELVEAARSGSSIEAATAAAPDEITLTQVSADDEYARLGVTPTPDDGTRLSATPLWDDSTRPHRPASGPEVTYSDLGREIGQHFLDVHGMLRRELEQVQDMIEQVRAGVLGVGDARSAINRMTMRQNDWTLGSYCASYCTMVTHHHTLEDDAVFPHLRRADPSLAPVIDRLGAEHLVIHDVLERVDAALVGLVREPGDLTGLDEAIAQLTDAMSSHLAYEEHELVEPMARFGLFPGQM